MPEQEDLIGTTESVCPVCLERIPAKRLAMGDEVRLVKECPKHGRFSAVVWRGSPSMPEWRRPKNPARLRDTPNATERGCPYDCGLCSEHAQRTCTALIEVTGRCDLLCPVCFAEAGDQDEDPDLEVIGSMLDKTMELTGGCNIQISGGEPTVRDDLPAIITLAKQRGFGFVQLNTHGLRFEREPEYAAELKAAGLDSVFLQFDGLRDETYKVLRGRPLADKKMGAVKALAEAGIGIVLVPTVIPGVNDEELGDIVRFAAERSPGVRGVHFQPVSYFGRYPDPPADDDRITLPELMRLLEEQTHRAVLSTHFHPPGCEHELCSFSAKYMVMPGGGLKPLSSERESCCAKPEDAVEGALRTISHVAGQWASPKGESAESCCCESSGPLDLGAFLERAAVHVMTISAMAFQDAWTLDLERLKGCCIHVATSDGRLIPFCAYNLTSQEGRPLYRGL